MPRCGTTCRRLQQLVVVDMSGTGITEDYTWKEEALELEITVQVPPGTTTRDVHFTPTRTSIDLRVTTNNNHAAANNNTTTTTVLLSGDRKLRGRVSLDGTFWVFADRQRHAITVTIEKDLGATHQYDVLDYDWKGVYPDETPLYIHYDEPQVLNVKEYAASLGVDVDNINRSMVDETMFTSGLNLTHNTLDQLMQQGYLEEITQQADGTEYSTNPETGELESTTAVNNKKSRIGRDPTRIQIPFLDTTSPWQQQRQSKPRQQQQPKQPQWASVPVDIDPDTKSPIITNEQALQAGLEQHQKQDQDATTTTKSSTKQKKTSKKIASNPMQELTVQRLRDILQQQGLKVSGSKQELQDRLQNHVNSLLLKKNNDNDAKD